MKMVNSNSFNTPAACCGEIYFNQRENRVDFRTQKRIARKKIRPVAIRQ